MFQGFLSALTASPTGPGCYWTTTAVHSSKDSMEASRTSTPCLSPPAASRVLRVKGFAESGLVLAWACCLLERAAWSASGGFPVPRGLSAPLWRLGKGS